MTPNSKLTLAAILLCSLPFLSGCQKHSPWNGSLEALMRSQPHRFATVMSDPAKHRLQIIYTQIDRDDENRPHFRSYTYRLRADEYFYPASTVKLPVALLALEKINRLNVAGLDRNTTMLTSAEGHGQTSVTADLTAPEGLPSVAHYIRKLLLVSDNDAFNRLYEFVGQAEINEFLRAKGEVESRREKANRPDLSRFMFDDQGNSISGLARPATQRIDRPANTTTHSSARTSQLRANSRKRVMTRLVVRCT
jgi:beta-lactamase class A